MSAEDRFGSAKQLQGVSNRGNHTHDLQYFSTQNTISKRIFFTSLLKSIYVVNSFRFCPDDHLPSVIRVASPSEDVDPSDAPENELCNVI